MSSIPSQERHVDPFASYNSDTVSKLTQMITRGKNGLAATKDLDIVSDSTSPTTHVVVKPGYVFKDNILIEIKSDFRLDFTDSASYVSFTTGFDEDGWYGIVLDYTYVKSKPPPTASVKILKPSQIPHPSIGTSLIFLKAVYVTGGGPHHIDTSTDFLDYYPSDPTIKREYVDMYFGVETTLPTHDPETDQGRVVYESSTDSFWFGYTNRWGKISAGVEVDIDTTGLNVGQLCYVDTDGKASAAIATSITTGAEMAVTAVGTQVDRSGRALMSGFVSQVPVETGIIINVGDLLYLSNTEAGRVTNLKTSPVYQIIGKAVSGGHSLAPINILFFPRDVLSGAITGTIEPGDWSGPDGTGLYYEVINISSLDVDTTSLAVLVNIWDASDNAKLSPADVKLSSNGNFLTIYSTINTVTWNYIISAGGGASAGSGGGGGGGGTNDHSLLFNLDFASSGHTGFAPSPHGNGHHSATYITASGVTFGNLNANGDVGSGAAQVAQGNHTHANLDDVPSGEIILFEKDTNVVGYTLLTTIDDSLVYITKGSAAGGEAGGSTKAGSTWTQPNHQHPTQSYALSISEIPSHNHGGYTGYYDLSHSHSFTGTTPQYGLSGLDGSYGQYLFGSGSSTSPLGISSSSGNHRHSISSQGGGGAHNHGLTSGSATASTWRPRGRNFTRQQRS